MLILSILSLFLGPVLYNYAERSNLALKLIDGFAFVALSSLIIFDQVIFAKEFNLIIFLIMFLGFLGPNFIEKILSRHSQSVHKVVLFLALVGLLFHSVADGAGLVEEIGHHGFLPLAVVLHKIPDGICLWWLVRPHLGKKISWLMIIALAGSTAFGYFYSIPVVTADPKLFSYLQAFVAGSILHVVFFRLHFHGQHDPAHVCCDEDKHSWMESLGNFLALLFLVFICFHEEDLDLSFFTRFWHIFVETAPALIFAHLISILVFAYLPRASIEWLKKGNIFVQAMKGMLIGLPLPICSCGVLPLYRTLLSRGAPMTAALAFLIATPAVGVDSIFISIPFLGLKLSVIRLAAAVILSLTVGVLLAQKKKSLLVISEEEPEKRDLFSAVKYSLFDVVKDTAPWIILGIGFATLIDQHQDLMKINTLPILQNLIVAVLSMVMYVCALESLPVASALMRAGVSPGSIVIFLLLGPATNLSSFLTLKNLHGKLLAFKFVFICLAVSLLIGFLVDSYLGTQNIIAVKSTMSSHNFFWGYLLGAWYLALFLKLGARTFFNIAGEHKH